MEFILNTDWVTVLTTGLAVLGGLVAVASVVVKLTPTPVDDAVVSSIGKALKAVHASGLLERLSVAKQKRTAGAVTPAADDIASVLAAVENPEHLAAIAADPELLAAVAADPEGAKATLTGTTSN